MSAALRSLRCSEVTPSGKIVSIGTTAREESTQASASSNHDGGRSRLPTTSIVVRRRAPPVSKVSAPSTWMSGISEPSLALAAPRVSYTGPGRWITYGVGRKVSTTKPTKATTSAHMPMPNRRAGVAPRVLLGCRSRAAYTDLRTVGPHPETCN
ncbi:hypothetical protein [Microbacterium sp. NIBRBAC000506063]|uniref:hypothetical protein n=1 Tax=Microbacterium sp. NIBRBAC000506063 TaxID=2734618 RepID=UPI001CB6D60B|nr:hypothetical protein [Microbacterium sp. NIBRBAC000506063]